MLSPSRSKALARGLPLCGVLIILSSSPECNLNFSNAMHELWPMPREDRVKIDKDSGTSTAPVWDRASRRRRRPHGPPLSDPRCGAHIQRRA